MNYFFLVILATLAFSSSKSDVTTEETNINFIKTSCNSTTYPTLCFTSLSVHSSTIQTSRKLLCHTALSIAHKATMSASAVMLKLSKRHGLQPREIGAMTDCIEVVSDSVVELKRSIKEMDNLKERSTDFYFMINNIQTWVSAALTDDCTCTDGFEGKGLNGKTKDAVRGKIVNVAQLTSNALALVNSYASQYV